MLSKKEAPISTIGTQRPYETRVPVTNGSTGEGAFIHSPGTVGNLGANISAHTVNSCAMWTEATGKKGCLLTSLGWADKPQKGEAHARGTK